MLKEVASVAPESAKKEEGVIKDPAAAKAAAVADQKVEVQKVAEAAPDVPAAAAAEPKKSETDGQGADEKEALKKKLQSHEKLIVQMHQKIQDIEKEKAKNEVAPAVAAAAAVKKEAVPVVGNGNPKPLGLKVTGGAAAESAKEAPVASQLEKPVKVKGQKIVEEKKQDAAEQKVAVPEITIDEGKGKDEKKPAAEEKKSV